MCKVSSKVIVGAKGINSRFSSGLPRRIWVLSPEMKIIENYKKNDRIFLKNVINVFSTHYTIFNWNDTFFGTHYKIFIEGQMHF